MLGVTQAPVSGTDLAVQIVFDFVFFMEAGLWSRWFRSEIGNIVGAAQFQRNKVVNFILPGRVADDAIFGVDLVLDALGNMAHCFCITWSADLNRSHIRENISRSAAYV